MSSIVRSTIREAFATSGVQKVLELMVVAGIGAALRHKLDAKAITSLLLNALVPAVIISSLSSLSLSSETGLVFLSGVALALIQLGAGELASRFVIPINRRKRTSTPSTNADDGEAQSTATSTSTSSILLRRTAALQLGTMAPALSVYSFTREFVGTTYAGLAALADVPTKLYTLLLIPYYLRYRAGSKQEEGTNTPKSEKSTTKSHQSLGTRFKGAVTDPFNLSISSGLFLAGIGRPSSSLGFLGNAIGSLAQAQTAVLFLLIGIKLQIEGDRPKLCLRLLLARHGFCNLAVSLFLSIFLIGATEASRLAAVLSSQAACSIIAFGQISKAVSNGVKGYDTDLAFDIVALSFPFTVMLNTVACVAGSTYVDLLPLIGILFLALSKLLG